MVDTVRERQAGSVELLSGYVVYGANDDHGQVFSLPVLYHFQRARTMPLNQRLSNEYAMRGNVVTLLELFALFAT
jgi:hypothetical protein